MTYEITFNALTLHCTVVGTATFTIVTDHPLNLEHKPLGFQRLCVEYARLIGISCSFAEIMEIVEITEVRQDD